MRVDFGARKLPEQPQAKRMPTHRLAEAGGARGFENAFTRGLRILAPRVVETPIDCAMTKPADPKTDPRMVKTPPKHVHYSGVIRSVAPCR
jgi:hypothetical protein